MKIKIQEEEEMLHMIEAFKHLRNQKGQGLVEYGLILALVALVCVGAMTNLGNGLQAFLATLVGKLPAAN